MPWGMGRWPEFYFKCAACNKLQQTIKESFLKVGDKYWLVCNTCNDEYQRNPNDTLESLLAKLKQ